MYGLAARFDAVRANPIRETHLPVGERKPARALTPLELEQVRQAVKVYAAKRGPGPLRGAMLPAYVELLAATGVRSGEVLAIRWQDGVDLLGDPATVTVNGTVLDHGRIPGKPVDRQDARKGDAPPHTVLLPAFGVQVLTALFGQTGSTAGPVLANRDGGMDQRLEHRQRTS